MKVALFSPGASEPLGHPVYAQKLCYHLSKNNELVIYTVEHPELNAELEKNGAALQVSQLYKNSVLDKNKYLKWKQLAPVVFGLKRIVYSYNLLSDFFRKNKNADVFHLLEFEYFSLLFIAIFKPSALKKTILSFHSADFAWVKGRSVFINLYKFSLSYLFYPALRRCAFIALQGHELKRVFIKSMHIHSLQHKVFVAGYGFEKTGDKIDKYTACANLSLNPEKKYVLLFGVLRDSKGTMEAIENFKYVHPDLTLLIAGSEWDISYQQVDAIIAANSLADRIVTRYGYIAESDIQSYFCSAELVIIPHKAGFLSFSGPLGLSVEYGKPVVASNVGEIGFFVTNGKVGEVFEANNWDDFVNSVNKCYKAHLNNSYQQQNEEFINSYTWESISKRINQVYLRIQPH